MQYLILTYWQVYAVLGASALAAFWGGWGACYLCFRPVITRHAPAHSARPQRPRPAPEPVPAQLPELPPRVAAALDVAHANVMARTAPHDLSPLVAAHAATGAITTTLARAGATAHILHKWAGDQSGDQLWEYPTGAFTVRMAELEHGPGPAA
jgi:hypothetical protein